MVCISTPFYDSVKPYLDDWRRNKIIRGDVLEFKRKGFVSWFLGGLLKLFEREWDGWGWHLAILWKQVPGGWYILEANADGVGLNYYTHKYLNNNTRVWCWLDNPPTESDMDKFLDEYKGKSYDVAIYFWTMLQYIIRHFFNHRIPRLLDDRFTCWELVFWFCREMGKPIQSIYDCPIISDFIKAVKNESSRKR